MPRRKSGYQLLLQLVLLPPSDKAQLCATVTHLRLPLLIACPPSAFRQQSSWDLGSEAATLSTDAQPPAKPPIYDHTRHVYGIYTECAWLLQRQQTGEKQLEARLCKAPAAFAVLRHPFGHIFSVVRRDRISTSPAKALKGF